MKASVIIPTYNRGALILDTLNTVLGQNYADVEIIVVDDGSTDNTLRVLEPYVVDGKIRLIRQAHFGKPSSARNRGLEEATGDVIFLLDSDDLMMPGKLSITMEALKKTDCSKVGFCCTDFIIRKPNGKEISHLSRDYYQQFHKQPRTYIDDETFLLGAREAHQSLFAGNFVGTSSVALPRWVIEAGYRFDETLTNSDDYDMWLRIASRNNILIINRPLHVYVENISGVLNKSMKSGSKWRTNIEILSRELKSTPYLICMRSARSRIKENYLALCQCEMENGRWVSAMRSLYGAFTEDFTGTLIWVLNKCTGRLRRIFHK